MLRYQSYAIKATLLSINNQMGKIEINKIWISINIIIGYQD